MIKLFFSNIGGGKTTLIARTVKKERKKIDKGKSKYKYIICNATVKGADYIGDIRKLLKTYALEDCLILIDEASIVYNNRKMVMTDREIEYFKLSRHYKSDIFVYSQSYSDCDVTLRRLYSSIYLINKLPFGLSLIRPIKKKIVIDEITKTIIDAYQFKWPFSWRLLFRPRYYSMFDSYYKPIHIKVYDIVANSDSLVNHLIYDNLPIHKRIKNFAIKLYIWFVNLINHSRNKESDITDL